MALINICISAIDLHSKSVGRDMACKQVFAKTRHHFLNADGSLNITNELRASFAGADTSVEQMNQEYLTALGVAQAQIPGNIPADWSPPMWRAPCFGVDSDMPGPHTQIMDNLRDRILREWQRLKGSPMTASQFKMYLGGMAAHSAYNKFDRPADEEEIYFDGEEGP